MITAALGAANGANAQNVRSTSSQVIDAVLWHELRLSVEKRRPLRRQPNDRNFGSLIMLAVTAGAFLLVTWVAAKGLFLLLLNARVRAIHPLQTPSKPGFGPDGTIGNAPN